MMSEIAKRLEEIRERMEAAATRAGRALGEVQLLAVSKRHPAEKIAEALEAGQTVFGESRVQEAVAKIPQLPGRAQWHFIGHLQKNKIRHALPLFEVLHAIDSLELAEQVDRIADEMGQNPRVFLEVNLAGEASKHGFSTGSLEAALEALIALPRLQIEGLMTIPPLQPDAEGSRRYFVQLRELRDRLQAEFRIGLPELSMGMSSDYEIAIEEGATVVRVGSAIFGDRAG